MGRQGSRDRVAISMEATVRAQVDSIREGLLHAVAAQAMLGEGDLAGGRLPEPTKEMSLGKSRPPPAWMAARSVPGAKACRARPHRRAQAERWHASTANHKPCQSTITLAIQRARSRLACALLLASAAKAARIRW